MNGENRTVRPVEFKDILQDMMNYRVDDDMIPDDVRKLTNSNCPVVMEAMGASLVLQALNGNLQAFTTVRDTIGQKPVDRVDQNTTVHVVMSDEAKELGE